MVREKANCRGPEDVRLEHRGKVPLPRREEIVEHKREYVVVQVSVSIFFASSDEDKHLANQPPCVNCPLDVFYYCETTGTECRLFKRYANGERGENSE